MENSGKQTVQIVSEQPNSSAHRQNQAQNLF